MVICYQISTFLHTHHLGIHSESREVVCGRAGAVDQTENDNPYRQDCRRLKLIV